MIKTLLVLLLSVSSLAYSAHYTAVDYYKLGRLYHTGEQGVPKNGKKAKVLYKKATLLDHGFASSYYNLARPYHIDEELLEEAILWDQGY